MSSQVVEIGIDLLLLLGATNGAPLFRQPAVSWEVVACCKMCHLVIDGDAGKDGCIAFGVWLTLLHNKQNRKVLLSICATICVMSVKLAYCIGLQTLLG